ncbi:MAG TPA: (2Fe-2S)-binding protein [Vicinamibacterales bacterium]|nr:(2Fe-2S)-binding protein [Vicinamibacterales bacterium]
MAPNSRRDFLKTVAAGSVAASVFRPGEVVGRQGPALVGPAEVAVTLTINNQRHQLKVEPRVTLLDVLRTRLDLTGTKDACDRGACGACTVVIDGRTYYSCAILAIEAQGRDIGTVEGLAPGHALHSIQQAFCDHDGVMCGFCTPGFVMAAVALATRHATPTVADAERALDGNMCRCGANRGVLAAVLDTKAGERG